MNAECREIRPLLSAYMDNDLSPDELRAMQAHVADCAECAAVLRDYRQLRASVRALPQPTPPPALRDAVFARATPAHRRRATLIALGQRGLSYAALAAATIAIFLTAALLLRGGGGPSVGSPDTTPPRVIAIAPGDGTIDWALGTPVRIAFSEPMDRDSIIKALVISADPPLSTEERGALLQNLRWDGNTLIIGEGALQPDTEYSFEIDPRLARDLAGNTLETGNAQITFRTIQPLPPTATAIIAAAPSPTVANPATATPTATATVRPTEVALPSNTPAALATPPPTTTVTAPFITPPTLTPTRTPSPAPIAPTATPQPAQPTATATVAPTATPPPTSTSTPAPTAPPTATQTPTPAPTATPQRSPYTIAPIFAPLYAGNADVVARIGLPTGTGATVPATYLAFERGWMLWRGDTRTIYVLFNEDPLVWYAFADGWAEGMATGGGPAEQAGYFKPARGFGKVWAENADVQRRLGFAVSQDEVSGTIIVQPFERGLLIANDLDAPLIYAFYQNNLFERFGR